jgi:hypothetical protein
MSRHEAFKLIPMLQPGIGSNKLGFRAEQMVRCYCDVANVTGVNAGVHETPQLAGYEKV